MLKKRRSTPGGRAGGRTGGLSCVYFGLRVAIGGRDLLGVAVGARDDLEHVRFGLVGVACDFGAQIFFRVVLRILDERGVLACECIAQLFQIRVNRPGCSRSHGVVPASMKRSTKFRV